MSSGTSVQGNTPFGYSLKLPVIDTILFIFWDKRFWSPIALEPLSCSNNFCCLFSNTEIFKNIPQYFIR